METIEKLVRPNIISLKPYSSARDEYEGNDGIFLDANENPFGTFNRYPDPYQKELKKRLSEKNGIPAENIFIGNGSDEIIDIVFRIFCVPGKDKALTFIPTYGMYEVCAGVNNAELISVPLNDSFQIDLTRTKEFFSDPYLKLIIICSPNNPTGNSFEPESIRKICSEFSGIVLLDEAYIDFSTSASLLDELSASPRLIICRTFSKARGLAAARVGVAYTSVEIIKYMNRVKPPYNVSRLNQQAALSVLDDEEEFRKKVELIISEREKLRAGLTEINAIKKIWPSDSNFLLTEVDDAGKLYSFLASRGIITRNRSSLVPRSLRITVGTPEENEKLISTLKQY